MPLYSFRPLSSWYISTMVVSQDGVEFATTHCSTWMVERVPLAVLSMLQQKSCLSKASRIHAMTANSGNV